MASLEHNSNAPVESISTPAALRSVAPTFAALLAPRLSLTSCVRAYMSRSTLGVDLSPLQRFNHLPASPLCSIRWLIHGTTTVMSRGTSEVDEAVPMISFMGPHTVPSVSFNPGPVYAFIAVLFPQAVQALARVDMEPLVNKIVPIESVLNDTWMTLARDVHAACDDTRRVELIEGFLEPRWRAVRQATLPSRDRLRHWVEGIALQAATSGIGKSMRQVERRVKGIAGLPLRDLRRLARADTSFFDARDAFVRDHEKSTPSWADFAAASGYSDQSHLCRETRRITGMSPSELIRAIEEEESFWAYRIWS